MAKGSLRLYPLNLIRIMPAEGAICGLGPPGIFFWERPVRRTKKFLFLLGSLLLGGGCEGRREGEALILLSYDSFASEWGPGPALAEAFREEEGIELFFIAPGDGVVALSRAIRDKDNPQADILLGMDNNLLSRALGEDILLPYKPARWEEIPPELRLDDSARFIPFDWAYFAICYDSQTLTNPPRSLEDLTRPAYQKSLILMDPRSSTPGLGFLLWTRAIYGADYLSYWQRLAPSVLTVTDSWSTAYGLFIAGEAPLVLSYSTSPVYHALWEDSDRYQTLSFEEGNYLQVEGMGILRGTKNFQGAQRFIDFALSPRGQEIIATANIMMPVMGDTELPEAFDLAFVTDSPLALGARELENQGDWVQAWVEGSGL